MDISTLENRIANKKRSIEKLNAKISKLENLISPDDVDFVKTSVNLKYGDWRRAYKDYAERNNLKEYHSQVDFDNLRSAYITLVDQSVTLDKYLNALKLEQSKANFLAEEKIAVIWEFLLKWKKEAAEYIRENTKWVRKYYDLNKQSCEFHNNSYKYKAQLGEDAYKEEYKRLHKEEDMARGMIHSITHEVYSYRDDSIDEDKLDKILQDEVDDKYLDMVRRVTKITGEITDASNLSINPKGDIDGIIIGEKGKAKIHTIGAGGENVNTIVNVKHGPIFHYRVLVREVK